MTKRTTGAQGAITAASIDPTGAISPVPTLPEDLINELAKVDRYAVEQLARFEGPNIFNPLIGYSPTDTFNNLESSLSLLHNLMDQDFEPNGSGEGLKLIVQTMWAAAQYEAFRAKEGGAA